MRVISGKYKNRFLKSSEHARPTLARVKESLFATINPYLANADVLDLFAGSGALGIEALSNGARSCVFVEKNKKVVAILKENLKFVDENYEVFTQDFCYITGQYDIILVDPPYGQNIINSVLNLIKEKELLKENGLVVIETEKETFSMDGFYIWREKKYGRKKIIILKKMEVEEDGNRPNS